MMVLSDLSLCPFHAVRKCTVDVNMLYSEGSSGGAFRLAHGKFSRDALKYDIRHASSLSTHYKLNLWNLCVIHECCKLTFLIFVVA